ncbi:hypothetical protein AX16_001376 [Volvariella volvacea WC 439]|nr:hypothetical protein AX16_001376 [Volvariella volvacea WC 439]
MLPTHISRSSPASSPTRGFPPIKSFIGRPLFRWIPLAIGCIFVLWIVARQLSYIEWVGRIPGPIDPHHKRPIPGEWGISPPPPRPHRVPTLWSRRAEQVREAFKYAYKGYDTYAFPRDELLPVSGESVNNFNGWGLTAFDALDTLWIMGLSEEWHRVVQLAANATFPCTSTSYAPFFETVIRYLGGLLSAYALSGEPILLSRADDLGKMLLPAFNTTSGLPMYAVNTVSGRTRGGWSGHALWSEVLSNQMEYKYLAHLTGRAEYFHKTERAMELMEQASHNFTVEGLFATMWDIELGTPANTQYSVGAFADSAHEYLLKQYLLTGRSEARARDLYLLSVNGIINNLLYITPRRHLLYVTDIHANQPSHKFEHLSCFLPALLALGVHTLDLSAQDKQLHQWAAQGLAETCWITYADQATGLGPDEMTMTSSLGDDSELEWDGRWIKHVRQWEKSRVTEAWMVASDVPPGVGPLKPMRDTAGRDYMNLKSGYLLRPETVESFYILWKTTGEVRWRERGWAVFDSLQKYAKTPQGFASVYNVNKLPVDLKDEMPSFFLAETLKYLYLLFSEEDILPLDRWVLNTEAHPLPVFQWKTWEKAEYDISH